MSESNAPASSAPVESTGTFNTESVDTTNAQTPAAEVPKSQDFLAPKFAALTRKEKQIRDMERQVRAQQAEVERLRSEYETKSKSNAESESQLMAKLKSNPLKALKEFGYDFEKLAEMQLNDENPTTEMQLKQIEERLRSEMEEKYGKLNETLKQKEEREAKERYDAAVNGYKHEITSFVSQNSDKYELILNNGPTGTDLLFETAEEYFNQTGRVPDHAEIADAVEAHFEEQANQIFKLKKFQKLQPKTEPKAMTSETAPTLSNTLSAEVPKSGVKQLDEQQSLELAASLLRWGQN